MDIRLKFTNPSTHDGDLAASVYLSQALEVEDYENVVQIDEYGQELESRELITRMQCNFQVGKERIIKVKMSPYNKAVIHKMIKEGPWEYADASEAVFLDKLEDVTPEELASKTPSRAAPKTKKSYKTNA